MIRQDNAYFNHSIILFVESIKAFDKLVKILKFLDCGSDGWTKLNKVLNDKRWW